MQNISINLGSEYGSYNTWWTPLIDASSVSETAYIYSWSISYGSSVYWLTS